MKFKQVSYTVVIKGEISYRDQHCSLYQAVNMFISAVKLDILTWGSMEIDSLLEPQVVVQGTAVFGTSSLASFYSPRGCNCGNLSTVLQLFLFQ